MTTDSCELPDETIQLTPDQMAMVKLADEAFQRGEGFSMEEVREMARKRTNAWLNATHSQSA